MSGRLAGKVALITGAGGGIGSESARMFAREGAAIVVNDMLPERANAVVQEIEGSGGRAIAAVADISVAAEVDAMFARTREAFGGLDILINNAFLAVNDVTIVDLEEADWDRTVDICLKGPFLCTRRALPMMRERGGGAVVSLSSVNALLAVSEPAYTAAKGGLISLMRLVASEYAEWNIRSNVICPGTIGTQVCIDYWAQYPAGFAKLKEMYPMGRIGTPREVANLILFLASDDASFITGSVHLVDGGLMAGRKLEVV